MTPDEIRQQLSTMDAWHHNVELMPGLWTNPQMGDHPYKRWDVIEPHIPKDLSGKTVLDVGCSSAFFSAMFKKRGAERVVAVEKNEPTIREAELLTTVFETPVEIVHMDIFDFLDQDQPRFDHVIFLGMFNHLRSPLRVIDRLSELTGERLYFHAWVRNEGASLRRMRRMLFAGYELGVLMKRGAGVRAVTTAWRTLTHPLELPDELDIESSYLMSHPEFPNLNFIPTSVNHDAENWWVGDTQTMRSILQTSGFHRVTQLSEDVFICDAL